MAEVLDITKSDAGAVGGLVKSKKYALTAAFVTAAMAIAATSTLAQVQMAALAASLLAVVGYLVSQAIVEAAAAKSLGGSQIVESEEMAEPVTTTK
jgi:hypothetical protein